MTDYKITVRREGNKHLATVFKKTGYDQREGASYKVLSVALHEDETTAILQAVEEAFPE